MSSNTRIEPINRILLLLLLLYDSVLTKFNRCIIMDDETYGSWIRSNYQENSFMFQRFVVVFLADTNILGMTSIQKKVMIYQSIYSCGREGKAFVTDSTINSVGWPER